MNINITIFTCLQFIAVHEKFTIQLFIQLIKNQTSLGCNQRTVCICIALISDITNGLALGINFIHHMNKIMFVISVITVTFGNRRIHFFKCSFYYIMHILYGNFRFSHAFYFFCCIPADKINLLFCKLIKNPSCRFIYRSYNLLHVKFFFCPVFFYNTHHFFHLYRHTISGMTFYFFRYFYPIFGISQYSTFYRS